MLMSTLRSQVRWIMIAIVILFVLSIFGMYGFQSPRKTPSRGEDYVVAEIDGKSVMRSLMDQQLRNYVETTNARDIGPEDLPKLYLATLKNMALISKLAEEAQNSGLKATEEELDAAVREVSDQFPTKEAFMQYVDRSGIKMKDFRDNLAHEIVQKKLLEQAAGAPVVTDEEAMEYYEILKPVFFQVPAGYTVDFIRLKTKEDADKVAAALAEGKEWNDAVNAVVSVDVIEKTPETGPVFLSGESMKESLAPLADLPLGKVSAPMEITSNDIMVAIKREKVEEKTTPFDEVSVDVKGLLTEEKKREAQAKFFKDLEDRTSIVILDQELFPKAEEKAEEENSTMPVSKDLTGEEEVKDKE